MTSIQIMDSSDGEYYDEAPRFLFSSRFGMAVLGFIGFFTMSSQKMSLQIALVCMVNDTAAAIVDGQSLPSNSGVENVALNGLDNSSEIITPSYLQQSGCGVADDVFRSYVKVSWFDDVSEKGTLVWDQTKRSVIFRTYYLGYLFSQIPAGLLAQRFGGKRVLGFCLLTASIATLLIPFGIRYHYFLLVFLRFIGGAGAGAAFPAMHCLLGRWAPPLERSKLASISYAGALTGSLATYPITTSLCRFGYDGGWPLVFYVLGGAGVLWFGLWVPCASESPLQHKRISKKEQEYIVAVLSKQADLEPTPDFHVPCGAVMSSLPFLAIVLSNFAYDWGLYMFENVVPVYLDEILDMDLRKVTLFSMMPYVSLWICVIMSGVWSDQLRERGVIGTRVTRKIFEFIGCVVPAAMTVGLGFLQCTQWEGAVAMVILGFSFLGFQYNGFLVNHIDIAPRYAAVLMGISNACGSLTHFLAPFMVSIIATEGTKEQWQTIFLATGCLYLFGLFVFLVCGSGEVQSWAKHSPVRLNSQKNASFLLRDPKRSSKLYNVELANPDIDRFKIGPQITTSSAERSLYQPLTQSNNIPSPPAVLNLRNGPPLRQHSVLENRQRFASDRVADISPYATLPRTRAAETTSASAATSYPGLREQRKPPEVEGYPNLRKSTDLSSYHPSFRNSVGPGDLNNVAAGQYLTPAVSGGTGTGGVERKSSRSSRDSRQSRVSADLSNRSSRHSADMTNKRHSRALNTTSSQDTSESVL